MRTKEIQGLVRATVAMELENEDRLDGDAESVEATRKGMVSTSRGHFGSRCIWPYGKK